MVTMNAILPSSLHFQSGISTNTRPIPKIAHDYSRNIYIVYSDLFIGHYYDLTCTFKVKESSPFDQCKMILKNKMKKPTYQPYF